MVTHVSEKEKKRVIEELLPQEHVQGVSIRPFSSPRVVLYVDEARPEIVKNLPVTYNDMPVVIKEVGRLRLLTYIGAPIGIDTGTVRTAGTLGLFLFKGGNGKGNGKGTEGFLISNNHVIALDFASLRLAKVGMPVYSLPSRQQIASLDYWERVDTDRNNRIDFALARLTDNTVSPLLSPSPQQLSASMRARYVIDNRLGVSNLARLRDVLRHIIRPGIVIHKFGRTTSHTSGTIFDTQATVRIKDVLGKEDVIFENTIIVEDQGRGIGDVGDSGSGGFILVDNNRIVPMGLLFAGSEHVTLFNNFIDIIDFIGRRYNVNDMYTVPADRVVDTDVDIQELLVSASSMEQPSLPQISQKTTTIDVMTTLGLIALGGLTLGGLALARRINKKRSELIRYGQTIQAEKNR